MTAGPNKQTYSRKEAARVLGIQERQLKSWESQELLPHLDEYAFADLIAVRSLQKLRSSHVPAIRIRRAVKALREKLRDVPNPLRDLQIVCDGKKVAVLLDGQKMEAVSGQLLLDFGRDELKSLLAFPAAGAKSKPSAAARQHEAVAWFEKGLELEQTGAPVAEIQKAYEHAIEFDPESAGALVNLGTIHYHLRHWTEAEGLYNRALDVDPTYALAHFNLGNLFDEKGDREAAIAHYQNALEANPNYADAYYNLALLHQSRGEPLKAVRCWKTYLKLDGASSWAAIARRELDKIRRAAIVEGSRDANDSSHTPLELGGWR